VHINGGLVPEAVEDLYPLEDEFLATLQRRDLEGLNAVDDAVHFLLEALQRNPDEDGQYTLCWEVGWTYLQNGAYAPALEYTDRAIHMKEFADLELSFNEGMILLAQGNLQEAEAVYDRAFARARALDNYGAIQEAVREANDFISQRGLQLDRGSRLFKLLQGTPKRPA
jgi:tetratricopeptide (TPR) repeat protein